MIVIRVALEIKTEEKETFLAHMKQEASEIKNQFEGCLWFQCYQDPTQANGFLLYEEWESQKAFDAYKASDYFKTNGAKLFPMMVGKPNSSYYDATSIPV